MKHNEIKMNELMNFVPFEIRAFTQALFDDNHWEVFIYILEGRTKYYKDLVKRFDICDLDKILCDLISGGVIMQYCTDLSAIEETKFYAATSIGDALINAMMDAVLPKAMCASELVNYKE